MTLALHGGQPVRRRPFPPRPPFGIPERNAANEVVASGQLSGFIGEPGDGFLGGPRVQSLEEAFKERFDVEHAVAMNSATSCLFAAVQVPTLPGDEVIVTPWSMSASAVCALEATCVPVFADIEPETFGLSYDSVLQALTPRTKAIVLVDLFGSVPRDAQRIVALARHRGIAVIEDAAQAIGASVGEEEAGTLGDVGIFSLNQNKTIHCGEGGVAITNDEKIAERLRLYRNHGENLDGVAWGGNHRLGELEAAVAEVQLGRLKELVEPRARNAARVNEALRELSGLVPSEPLPGTVHAYYAHVTRILKPLSVDRFAEALRAEGIPAKRYVAPLNLLPVFAAFSVECKAAEAAYAETIVHSLVHAGMTGKDVDDVIAAFRKVWQHREHL